MLAGSSVVCLTLGVGLSLGSIYFFVDGLFERRGNPGCYDSCLGYAFGTVLVVPGLCMTIISLALLVNACIRLRRKQIDHAGAIGHAGAMLGTVNATGQP